MLIVVPGMGPSAVVTSDGMMMRTVVVATAMAACGQDKGRATSEPYTVPLERGFYCTRYTGDIGEGTGLSICFRAERPCVRYRTGMIKAGHEHGDCLLMPRAACFSALHLVSGERRETCASDFKSCELHRGYTTEHQSADLVDLSECAATE